MLEKHCGKCDSLLPAKSFNWKDKRRGKLGSICKKCNKLYQQEYHKKTYKPKLNISKNVPKIPDEILIDECDRKILEDLGNWHVGDKGYARKTIRVNGKSKSCMMHRFIWEKNRGKIPQGLQVDHKNGNKLDNRIDNLRLVTNQENQWNQTKARGYHFDKSSGKWIAQIGYNKKPKYLGLFSSEEEARQAYLEAKEKFHKIQERH